MRDGCIQALKENGCQEENIISIEVPGAFELTSGAKYLLEYKDLDAIICLGCIIKGATKHAKYIAIAVGNGITQLNLDHQKNYQRCELLRIITYQFGLYIIYPISIHIENTREILRETPAYKLSALFSLTDPLKP